MKIFINQEWDQSIKICEAGRRSYSPERKSLEWPGHSRRGSMLEDGLGRKIPSWWDRGWGSAPALLLSQPDWSYDLGRNRPLLSRKSKTSAAEELRAKSNLGELLSGARAQAVWGGSAQLSPLPNLLIFPWKVWLCSSRLGLGIRIFTRLQALLTISQAWKTPYSFRLPTCVSPTVGLYKSPWAWVNQQSLALGAPTFPPTASTIIIFPFILLPITPWS